MFKKLSAKVRRGSRKSTGDASEAAGAAVPYSDVPDPAVDPRRESNTNELVINAVLAHSPGPQKRKERASRGSRSSRGSHESGTTSSSSSLQTNANALVDAARRNDIETVRSQLKEHKVDINARHENGDTALHAASSEGHSRMVRYLLLHGSDVELRNKRGRKCLYVSVEGGHTGTVGVLLDFMHSVDTRSRDPFILLRARRYSNGSYFVEKVDHCKDLKPYRQRDVDHIQIFIAHGQDAMAMAVFLYSVLDVQVSHAFFQNGLGDLNMRNFQRFESKEKSQSLTVLHTRVVVMETNGYEHLRSLILVSCDLLKLTMAGLRNLELLDARYNELDGLPESIKDCVQLKTLRLSHNKIKRISRDIGELKALQCLEACHNGLRSISSNVVKCTELRYLQLNHNDLQALPVDIGLCSKLEDLLIHNNKLSALPLSISALLNLKRIKFDVNPLTNIPVDFPERATEVREYLTSLQDDPTTNKTVKLVLVGQEGVGKTTLLGAIKRTLWLLPHSPRTPKTEGVEVKDIMVDDLTFRTFDCGGDVDFNETHTFFITQGALYLACFNLSEYTQATVERSSFLLGRLQLWLQYIFSKVPAARVIIVGTHADSATLGRKQFEDIWDLLRTLLVSARSHHQQYFLKKDRVSDCFLCQSDSKCLRRAMGEGPTGYVNLGMDDSSSTEEETSFNDGPARIVSFPHIVGYYEVSSVKSMGNTGPFQFTSNKSIEQLKDAIVEVGHKLVRKLPEIPRKWVNVLESVKSHAELEPEQSVVALTDVARLAAAQGVHEPSELDHMLHFLKAQGSVLFFPQSEELKDLVVLDPEWLAQIFAKVVSFRDTGISNEGFMDRNKLEDTYSHVDKSVRDRILGLLHYFGVCIPIEGTNMELFPSKLPIGEPDDTAWPVVPDKGHKQVTYSITFPTLIPPPLFSDLLVAVYRKHAQNSSLGRHSNYFSNQILECMNLSRVGCRDCGLDSDRNQSKDELLHKVLFELVAHRRTLIITTRGSHPCCMMRHINGLLNKVVGRYEGLGNLELDTLLCPGCFIEMPKQMHRFSAKLLSADNNNTDKIVCSNKHTLGTAQAILRGEITETCLPYATIKPKTARERMDFTGCPRLFVMLPLTQNGLSFDEESRLFASSILIDGYAAHLLCEFPDGYHLTNTPGFRLKHPKEFMRQYGDHVISILRMLSHMVMSSVVSSTLSRNTRSLSKKIEDLISDYQRKFGLKDTTKDISPEDLVTRVQVRGDALRRDPLRTQLHVIDRPDTFGPLRRLYFNEQTLWLCNEHYRQLRVLQVGLHDPPDLEGTPA